MPVSTVKAAGGPVSVTTTPLTTMMRTAFANNTTTTATGQMKIVAWKRRKNETSIQIYYIQTNT